MPGLQYIESPNDVGLPLIAIRGIVAGTGLSPTVAPTIDGVPFGSSTGFGGAGIVPDFDPSDLERIEVLKGPQGTLYGANSLGGLLQYVTVDPSLGAVSGRVSVGASDVTNGTQAGANVRAAINVPLSDTVAVRVSGYARQDPGYIDDPTNFIDGVNKFDSGGGHVAVLWQPSDNFSAKFSALFQHDEQYGAPYVDSPMAGVPITTPSDLALVQDRLPGTGTEDRRLQAYILTLDAKLNPFDHPIDLISISSYSRNTVAESFDGSFNPAATAPAPFVPSTDTPGVFSVIHSTTEKITQELRLSTAIGSKIDWLFGAFFTHENSGFATSLQDGIFETVGLGTPAILEGTDPISSTYKEYAVFTNFTFKITDRFDIQVGGRGSKTQDDVLETIGGPIGMLEGQLGGTTMQGGDSSNNSATYLFTPRYKLIEDPSTKVMVYARLASGFRPGGINTVTDPNAQLLPNHFGPDRTYNYDLGLKADLMNRTLFVDLSAFYIDWRSIQLSAIGAPDAASPLMLANSGFVNGSRARSDGVEFSTEYRPLPGLSIDANVSYDDAVLRDSLPIVAAATTIANSGDRLPLSARFVGNIGANYEFPLPIYNELRGFAGAQYSYTGGREGLFAETTLPTRQYYGAYGSANLQLGAKWSTWTAELYGNNLSDRRGVLGGGFDGGRPPYQFIYDTPRTVGVELSTSF